MHITIEPTELMSTAVTLGTAAVELADIGSSLTSCVGCAMPPEVRNMADQIVATTDVILDTAASVLRTQAGDLAQRALIAANDSVAAAAIAATTTGVTIVGGSPVNSAGIDLSTSIFPGGPNVGMFDDGADGVLGLDDIQGQATLNSLFRRSIAPMSGTAIVGGASWGTPAVIGPDPSFGASNGIAAAQHSGQTVGGRWTSSSIEIGLVGPDGNPVGYSAGQLSEFLSESGRRTGAPGAIGLNGPAATYAMGPLMATMRNGIDYNTFATNQNQFGVTPPPQHQSPYRN